MLYIYFGTIFAAMVVFFLVGTLLFLRRKEGERSRTMLAFMMLISVGNYIGRIVNFRESQSSSFEVMPVSLLLLGLFVMTTYIMYPIEVVSPGWLTWKRVIKIYMPMAMLWLLYKITLLQGMVYTHFRSVGDLLQHISMFEVLFRIVLASLIFLPAVLLYFVPYTRKYNNTDYLWMRKYVVLVVINMFAFLLVISSDAILVRTFYYAVSVFCSLYLAYQELFVRLIREPMEEKDFSSHVDMPQDSPSSITDLEPEIHYNPALQTRGDTLFERLEEYMDRTQAWRNPDLSVSMLTRALYTNRTSLREAMLKNGCTSYTSYINGKRIAEFIRIIERGECFNYQEAFFDVGFRCKTTAIHNFREIIGMVPSEYFQKQNTQSKCME